MVGILNQLFQFDGLEFLFFVDRLILNVLHKFRRVVHGLHRELGGSLGRSTGSVSCSEGHGFRAIPEFVRDLDICRTVLVDIELEVLVARNAPLELHDIVINVSHVVREADRFEFVLFFDGLVRNLLDDRSVINRLYHEVCGRRGASVFAVGGSKLDLCGAVPVLVRNDHGGDAVRINFHIQVAISLILAHRLDVEFPQNLVLRMVGVRHKIIELNLGEGLTFIDGLVLNLLDFRRIVYGFNIEVYRFRTDGTLGVRGHERNVFGAVPIFARNFNRCNAFGRNGNLELLIARDRPFQLFGLVMVVSDILVQLNRGEFTTFVNRFPRNPHYRRSTIFFLSNTYRCQNTD